MKKLSRCEWSCGSDLMMHYHDTEWGVPLHDDTRFFEFLILDGAQAGLSWLTILKRREGYREAFDNFDVEKVARYDARKVKSLLANPGIIRNRLKVEGAIKNAKAFLAVQKEFGSFDKFIWQFVGGKPQINRPKTSRDIPATSETSDRMSREL